MQSMADSPTMRRSPELQSAARTFNCGACPGDGSQADQRLRAHPQKLLHYAQVQLGSRTWQDL